MRSRHQVRVEQFMKGMHEHPVGRARQPLPLKPTPLTSEVRKLRARLILEEAMETIAGLGVALYDENENDLTGTWSDLDVVDVDTFSMIYTIDGLCDLSVVVNGTAASMGIPLEPFIEEVDDNNLAKLGPGHTFHTNGKLLKPPGHKPPDFNAVLEAFGYKE